MIPLSQQRQLIFKLLNRGERSYEWMVAQLSKRGILSDEAHETVVKMVRDDELIYTKDRKLRLAE